MIGLLAKIFIKNSGDTDDPGVRLAYGTLCGALGIAWNLLLAAGKLFAGVLSHSIAVMADAANNLSDAGSSVVTLVGFRLAGQKPDPEHPFGHGRFEYIAGFIVSIAILLMGFSLLKDSFLKVLNPQPVAFSPVVAIILVASVLVKLYMAFYNYRYGKRLSSSAMRATAADSLSDSVATTVVLLSMFVGKWTGIMIDGWCGLAVAVFIIFAGIRAAKETLSPLLGQPADPHMVAEIERIVMAHEPIIGIHDLVIHDYGPGRCMVSLHAEVPASGDIRHIHDVIDNVEKKLNATLGCEAVIHMDPLETDDELTTKTRDKLADLVKVIDERCTIHDFRMVTGPTHTNLLFDIVVPHGFRLTDAEIRRDVDRLVASLDRDYNAVIQIDKSYV